MKATYNVTGDERKALVRIISEVIGMKPVYMRMPTCAYVIAGITVEKTERWSGTSAPTTPPLKQSRLPFQMRALPLKKIRSQRSLPMNMVWWCRCRKPASQKTPSITCTGSLRPRAA